MSCCRYMGLWLVEAVAANVGLVEVQQVSTAHDLQARFASRRGELDLTDLVQICMIRFVTGPCSLHGVPFGHFR